MCTVHLKELTVAWQNSKPVSCIMHAFLQNLFRIALQRLCMNQYPSFICTETQLYIFPIVGLSFFFFFFFFFFFLFCFVFFARYKNREIRLYIFVLKGKRLELYLSLRSWIFFQDYLSHSSRYGAFFSRNIFLISKTDFVVTY